MNRQSSLFEGDLKLTIQPEDGGTVGLTFQGGHLTIAASMSLEEADRTIAELSRVIREIRGEGGPR